MIDKESPRRIIRATLGTRVSAHSFSVKKSLLHEAYQSAEISKQNKILMNVRAGAPNALAPMSAYVMSRGSS